MVLQERITLVAKLGQYFLENKAEWQEAMKSANQQNAWFTLDYIKLAVDNIRRHFLQTDKLEQWSTDFTTIQNDRAKVPVVGLVMAGNLPLVGFHDFLSVFISGCKQRIKLSSKDSVLWNFIFDLLGQWHPQFTSYVSVRERLDGCDAYIATGSNNTAKTFKYYFSKYPHIIRSNRTSVAILTGNETEQELNLLSDDICSYFGFGCRNVSKIHVPDNYDFEPLIRALNRYAHHMDHHQYKNNYDFQLALYLLNKIPYQSSENMLLIPSESAFAPISVLHYEFYKTEAELIETLSGSEELQCIVGNSKSLESELKLTKFGHTQQPDLEEYADGINTLDFLKKLLGEQKTTV